MFVPSVVTKMLVSIIFRFRSILILENRPVCWAIH